MRIIKRKPNREKNEYVFMFIQTTKITSCFISICNRTHPNASDSVHICVLEFQCRNESEQKYVLKTETVFCVFIYIFAFASEFLFRFRADCVNFEIIYSSLAYSSIVYISTTQTTL